MKYENELNALRPREYELRDENRIDPIIDAIRKKWKENPQFRFHQLLQALNIETTKDNFYKNDESIIETLAIPDVHEWSKKYYDLSVTGYRSDNVDIKADNLTTDTKSKDANLKIVIKKWKRW